MRFDYDAAGPGVVARVLDENSVRLSRTRSGVSDTSTSPEKRPLALAGEALRQRAAANERRVQEFLFRTRHDPAPRDGPEVLRLLWAVADLTNEGLLPSGQRLRTWASRPGPDGPAADRTAPAELPAALDRFAAEVHRRWPELAGDPVPLASRAEWELNGGSLHPFYDGCGRISRSFGALLLIRGSWLLPLYDQLDSYFARGHAGPAAFAGYVAERVLECARWLDPAGPHGGNAPPV
jgi:hypothetical protein